MARRNGNMLSVKSFRLIGFGQARENNGDIRLFRRAAGGFYELFIGNVTGRFKTFIGISLLNAVNLIAFREFYGDTPGPGNLFLSLRPVCRLRWDSHGSLPAALVAGILGEAADNGQPGNIGQRKNLFLVL